MPRRTRFSLPVLSTLVLPCVLAVAPAAPAVAGPQLPGEYVVSTEQGVLPEGITVEPDGTMYVTSAASGAVYRGHVREPELTLFLPPGGDGRDAALGVHSDHRGRVFVVGGASLYVYDRHGRLLARRSAAGGPLAAAYLNDLVITHDAVYVTDWTNAAVYRAELHGNEIGELAQWLDIRPAWPAFPAQYWLLNGIVADPAGNILLVASNGTEAVWRVDVATREVSQVDLGGESFGADGLVLDGTRLYGVLVYGAPDGVYVAELDGELRAGRVVHRITDGPWDTPTTLANHLCRLYVVNSQFGRAPGTPPYTVAAVADPACRAA